MTKPQRPIEPQAVAEARAYAEALVLHEQELQAYERQQAADALTTARKAEVARQTRCKAACQQAADHAASLITQLVAALDQYVAASEQPFHTIRGQVQNFLAAHGVGKYVAYSGDLTGRPSGIPPYPTDTTTYLLAGLFPEAE